VANTKKPPPRTRRDRVEELRREQQAAQRRKNAVFLTVAVVIAIGLVLAAVLPTYYKHKNDLTRKAIQALGVSTSAASCDAVTNDPAAQSGVHVGPGTNQPNVTRVKYADVPPSWGEHFVSPVYPNHAFYTVADGHQVEEFVHNLEHGYTVLWYDRSISGKDLDVLKAVATKARELQQAGPTGKFLAVPWDPSYGAFPAGKKYALSHWSGNKMGHRELCGGLSGSVVESFMKQFPYSDAPEPNAE
jgi:Protein of unknown function (DUF3105)